MPFTFAHPAIVLPFIHKRWKLLSATGLIAGSIAPDFESFIGLGVDKVYSHTWTGLFWFDLPIALLLALVFHVIVKQPFIDHLPSSLSGRLQQLRNNDWVSYANTHYIIVISSCLLGVFSHLLWDAFTHLNLLHPDAISSRIYWHGRRVYILLQYSNSIIGLAVLSIYVYMQPTVITLKKHTEKYKFWLYILLIAAAVSTFALTTLAEEEWLKDKKYLVEVGISGLMYGLILVSLFYKIAYPKQNC